MTVTLSGLYYVDFPGSIRNVLSYCPLLTSPYAIEGSHSSSLQKTWWMFNGDMRTFYPFQFFYPKPVDYRRRFVRVPLSDGPLCAMEQECVEGKRYEAIAVDYIPVELHASDKPCKVLIILAGLTI